MNNDDKFKEFRIKYKTFIYEKHEIIFDDNYMIIKY